MTFISKTPPPPYFTVIFTSERTGDDDGYGDTSVRMLELASKEEGYLGAESARNAEGQGITVSYWRALEDIKRWKANTEHLLAQKSGREKWYSRYKVRIAQVQRDYGMNDI